MIAKLNRGEWFKQKKFCGPIVADHSAISALPDSSDRFAFGSPKVVGLTPPKQPLLADVRGALRKSAQRCSAPYQRLALELLIKKSCSVAARAVRCKRYDRGAIGDYLTA